MSGETETELKFAVRPADLDRIAAGVASAAGGPLEARTLVSTYHDTADRRLRAAGLSLRLRQGGERPEQTLKGELSDVSTMIRSEITVPIQASEPDLSAFGENRAALLAAEVADGRALEPAFVTRVERATASISVDGAEVEVAVDRGAIEAGERRIPLSEVEFELKSGDPKALFAAARAVLAGVPARPLREAKSARGFRLLDGDGHAAPAAAGAIALEADATVEAALQAVLRSCLAQVADNVLAIEAGDDPEGAHQLRVGLRRLRSALKVFGPVIDPAAAARIDGEARWLGAVVGRMRDLDVLAEETVGGCAGHVDARDLLDLLAERRRAERAALLATFEGERLSAFLLDLVAFAEGRGWLSATDIGQSAALAAPAAPFARKALSRRWARTARKGRHADDLTPEERHRLRKSFKALRYALEFLGPLLPRREVKRLARQVKAAQEVLGYLNDVRNAETLVSIVASATGRRRQPAAVERAVGFCLGWHAAQAERVWDEARDLVSLDPRAISGSKAFKNA